MNISKISIENLLPKCTFCKDPILDDIYTSKKKGITLCEKCATVFDEYQDELTEYSLMKGKVICADCGRQINNNEKSITFITDETFPFGYKKFNYTFFHQNCIEKEPKKGWEISNAILEDKIA